MNIPSFLCDGISIAAVWSHKAGALQTGAQNAKGCTDQQNRQQQKEAACHQKKGDQHRQRQHQQEHRGDLSQPPGDPKGQTQGADEKPAEQDQYQ